MIACLIAVQILATTSFQVVQIPARDLDEAHRLAAVQAGRIAARTRFSGSRIGFECDRQGWVAVDLERADVFGSARNTARQEPPAASAAPLRE